ncbi:MAG: glycosyltransferase family 4 protein [Gammaproteobacteria bacterium]
MGVSPSASASGAPLHILHTEASRGWGGQELRILAELEGFAERGHRTRLLAPEDSNILRVARERGVPCEAFPFNRPLSRAGLRDIRRLRAWMRANPVDVIVTHSSLDSWLIGLARVGLKGAPAVVRTRHVSAPITNNFASRWLYTRSVERIATTGEVIRRHIIDTMGAEPDRVEAIPTGVDPALFDPGALPDRTGLRAGLGLPEQGRLLGIAATLRNWKGHTELLDAFEAIQADYPDLELVIAGDGPQRKNIEARAAAMGGGDRVHVLGHRTDVPRVMAALDLFSLPSWSNEGVPQAIVQAMVMGLPIVTTDAGSIAEVIDHERNGLIVNKRDAADLAVGLRRMLHDPDLAARLGTTARADALAHHTMAHTLDRMDAIMRKAIADRAIADRTSGDRQAG